MHIDEGANVQLCQSVRGQMSLHAIFGQGANVRGGTCPTLCFCAVQPCLCRACSETPKTIMAQMTRVQCRSFVMPIHLAGFNAKINSHVVIHTTFIFFTTTS